jgi:4-methyl-5(b-hydroxyethyl)-thiazole monophosphate biosynthesis
VKLVADVLIDECKTYEWDLIAIPGGMPGATSLRECVVLCEMLVKQNTQGKSLGAVCAAPAVVLAPLSILDGKKATCYPAAKFRTSLPTETDDRVTVDGNIITSQGPGKL